MYFQEPDLFSSSFNSLKILGMNSSIFKDVTSMLCTHLELLQVSTKAESFGLMKIVSYWQNALPVTQPTASKH